MVKTTAPYRRQWADRAPWGYIEGTISKPFKRSDDELREGMRRMRTDIQKAYEQYDIWRSRYKDLLSRQSWGLKPRLLDEWSPEWTLQDGENAYLRKSLHLAGENPGDLSGWSQDCTMLDFDAAYIMRAREIAEAVTFNENVIAKGIRVARKYRFTAYSDQKSNFPSASGGYTDGKERALASAAPVERIRSWQGKVPWVENDPLSPNVEPDPRHDDPPPDDMGNYSDLREVDITDSWGNAAFGPWRRRIDAWQQRVESNTEEGSRLVAEEDQGRRTQWTLTDERREKLEALLGNGVGRELSQGQS